MGSVCFLYLVLMFQTLSSAINVFLSWILFELRLYPSLMNQCTVGLSGVLFSLLVLRCNHPRAQTSRYHHRAHTISSMPLFISLDWILSIVSLDSCKCPPICIRGFCLLSCSFSCQTSLSLGICLASWWPTHVRSSTPLGYGVTLFHLFHLLMLLFVVAQICTPSGLGFLPLPLTP